MGVNVLIRRRVRPIGVENETRRFRTWSFTTAQGVEWHPSIDLERGVYRCDCPHHLYRGAFCKHLRRAAQQLVRSGDVSPEERAVLRGKLLGC